MTDLIDTSVSDFVRQVLFIHLYGRSDLLGLYERKRGIYAPAGDIRFSRITNPKGLRRSQPEKKTADVKIWLPSRMKNDLATLAVCHKMKLSKYVCQVITTHLLGNLPFDPDLVGLSPPNSSDEE